MYVVSVIINQSIKMSKTPKRKRNDYEINDKREMVYFQEKNPQMTSAIKITF
jgi:hypothetical protein